MSKAGGFKSYLNVFQPDRDKATFKSYVDIEAEDEEEEPEEVISNATAFFDANLMPPLLPGEWLVAKGHNVLKYSPFTEKKQGISGMLFVTNFRIAFLTGDRSSYDQPGQIQKNLLVPEDDIPLISIDSAFQVSVSSSSLSTARRKKLVHGMTISGQTKYLELHCKNFRLHRFGLIRTPAGEDKKILNAITAFGFPNRPQLLFAMEYGRNSNFKNSDGRNHLYMIPSDWEWELDRLGGIMGWEVTQVNERFNLSDCLPESFTMPAKLPVSVMKSDTIHFVDNRPPTWSYTYVNGASLVRMSCLRTDTTMTDVESRAVEAVRLTHARGRTPTVMDLGKECPSLRDLQWSYEKLKELLLIDSEKDFWSTDLTWFSSLENTKWLQSVQSCLLLALKVTKEMEERERTVILKEAGGRDFSCLVSSLVQLMLDPDSRTLGGFQLLIQKEWVAMAHPFQQRCGLIRSADSLESPVFLLFLDCVWQMLQQFPSSFAFTETYLTTVWDSIYIGLFETFLFDSPHQQKSLLVGMTKTTVPPICLPSVWKWDFQFGNEYRSFFNNPLYLNKADIYSQLNNTKPRVGKGGGKVLANGDGHSNEANLSQIYSRKLHKLYENEPNLHYKGVVLKPDCSTPLIRLWSQCYLRWLEPAEIIGGGSPAHYMQQCLLVEEVLCLQHKMQSLMEDKEKRGRLTRPRSDLIFSFDHVDNANAASLLNSSVMTSSFPFSPTSPTSKAHHTRVFTPLSSYLENSSLDFDVYPDE